MIRYLRRALVSLLLATPLAHAHANDTLFLVVPTAAGGNSDAYVRVLAPTLPLPGVKVLVRNLPGAGGAVLCRHYLEEPNANEVMLLTPGILSVLMGTIAESCARENLLSMLARFGLGAAVPESRVLVFRPSAGIRRPEDLPTLKGKILYLAATSKEGPTALIAKSVLKSVGIPMGFPGVYRGVGETKHAITSKEADVAMETVLDFIGFSGGLTAGCAFGIFRNGMHSRDPRIPNVPTCVEFVRQYAGAASDELKLVKAVSEAVMVGDPFFASPGFSSAQVELLRTAFSEAHKDPKYLTIAKKSRASEEFIEIGEYRKRVRAAREQLDAVNIGGLIQAIYAD